MATKQGIALGLATSGSFDDSIPDLSWQLAEMPEFQEQVNCLMKALNIQLDYAWLNASNATPAEDYLRFFVATIFIAGSLHGQLFGEHPSLDLKAGTAK